MCVCVHIQEDVVLQAISTKFYCTCILSVKGQPVQINPIAEHIWRQQIEGHHNKKFKICKKQTNYCKRNWTTKTTTATHQDHRRIAAAAAAMWSTRNKSKGRQPYNLDPWTIWIRIAKSAGTWTRAMTCMDMDKLSFHSLIVSRCVKRMNHAADILSLNIPVPLDQDMLIASWKRRKHLFNRMSNQILLIKLFRVKWTCKFFNSK